MPEMLSLPRFLSLFLTLPAHQSPRASDTRSTKRHRAIQVLRLSPHILRDVGMEDYDGIANDPRWVRRPDLDR